MAGYWKDYLGIPAYKWSYLSKMSLYRVFGILLPKLRSQRDYWMDRGRVYMHEIQESGYLERERFFQDMLIAKLGELEFDSFFEAGCGFGWNIRRVKEAFPRTRCGGLDFSATQLANARRYCEPHPMQLVMGDACRMPLRDDAFVIGFSLGVFLNIHPDLIESAAREMMRVCRRYIIHLEYDQEQTTAELRERRIFKTNIVSHDYRALYTALGARVLEFKTYRDFGDAYSRHAKSITSRLDRWEGFEGAEKYVWILVEV